MAINVHPADFMTNTVLLVSACLTGADASVFKRKRADSDTSDASTRMGSSSESEDAMYGPFDMNVAGIAGNQQTQNVCTTVGAYNDDSHWADARLAGNQGGAGVAAWYDIGLRLNHRLQCLLAEEESESDDDFSLPPCSVAPNYAGVFSPKLMREDSIHGWNVIGTRIASVFAQMAAEEDEKEREAEHICMSHVATGTATFKQTDIQSDTCSDDVSTRVGSCSDMEDATDGPFAVAVATDVGDAWPQNLPGPVGSHGDDEDATGFPVAGSLAYADVIDWHDVGLRLSHCLKQALAEPDLGPDDVVLPRNVSTAKIYVGESPAGPFRRGNFAGGSLYDWSDVGARVADVFARVSRGRGSCSKLKLAAA